LALLAGLKREGYRPSMSRYLAWLLMLCASLSFTCASAISSWEELSAKQQAQLSSGKAVVIEEDVPGEPWPILTIYQIANCSPEEIAGVFWDSELDTKYLTGCRSVGFVERPTPSVQVAEFTLKMPFFLPDEVYTSRIELIPQTPGRYKITWRILESRYAKSCNGSVLLEPLSGKTLIRYRNFMAPHSRVAVLMRSPARDRVVESVQALVNQVEKEKRESPQLMSQQQKDLMRALGK
jgi:hypothetical protein